ncbi:RagB/SusD family nutrient uptake outer membrane protein [Bacteroides sp. GM023]|uniref:RagB/SusD family nutrient uptake outer membrane protein n=1 Tax=Bacteroides sp. GM023 TaxID=2723058 RepID=UPI00168B4B47|nr:RagB/SusD family nutrient uptake outer membrane protein [Bacteroides sp. GM023]MBD3591734.1 RagB/SusD family nutrient uptake outer membrane protein [Bacteroides sp. GM023]
MNFTLIKKSLVGLLAIVLSTGCADLTENLTGQPTVDKFFQTLTDFNSYIVGAYTPLILLYGTDMPYVAGSGAEDVYTPVVRWKGFEQVNINTVGNPDEVTDELWNTYYTSISACNTLIQIIGENTKLSSEELSPIDGEARFLRAFNYFQLVRWFGEVPLLTEENQNNAAVEPQSTIAQIYGLIVSDLKSAELTLPISQEDPSRPSRWAAKALLAKVYLTMAGYPLNDASCYALARDKAGEVITEEVYTLEKVYSQLWLWSNRKTNTEFIFALYASSDNGIGSYTHQAVRPADHGENGWGDWTSDKRFLAAFPAGDGSRVNGTFYTRMIDGSSWENTNIAQPYVGKLRDAGPKSGGYSGIATANKADGFFCMLRYADVLLIYAEAANLAEGKPSKAAYQALNEVRKRAGLAELSDLTSAQFDKAVLEERNWELAFECNRWFDLCRRHILKETMQVYYPESKIDDHNYLLPKPSDQMTIMTGIVQNPGYN